MDSITLQAIRNLCDMIETAEGAIQREKTEMGKTWYKGKSEDLQDTMKRIVNNACDSQ